MADDETSEVPWLDADEMEAWLGLVSLTIRLSGALDAQLRCDAGLSHFEYQVLAVLSMTEGHTMPMSEIAEFTEGSLSRLSHVCRRLEERGWIRRSPDPDDGRVTLASLTDAGMEKMVESAPGHVRGVRSLVFDGLTQAQVRQLAEITRRINAAIADQR